MSTEKKGLKVAYAKSIDPDKKTALAYVSTTEWDRTDERFEKGAWVMDHYRNNPVVMWAHDYSKPPIGKAIRIEEDQKGLLAETQFADDDFSQQIFKLYAGGFLSAFSVGFAPKSWTEEDMGNGRKGIVYTKADLLEYSAVSIPANPGALIGREIGEIAQKMLPESVREIEVEGEKKFLVMDPTLKPTAPPDFEASLKSILDLAKDARRNRLPGNQLSILKTASAQLIEIIAENDEEVDPALILNLQETVKGLGDIMMAQYSDEATRARVKQIVREIQKY